MKEPFRFHSQGIICSLPHSLISYQEPTVGAYLPTSDDVRRILGFSFRLQMTKHTASKNLTELYPVCVRTERPRSLSVSLYLVTLFAFATWEGCLSGLQPLLPLSRRRGITCTRARARTLTLFVSPSVAPRTTSFSLWQFLFLAGL